MLKSDHILMSWLLPIDRHHCKPIFKYRLRKSLRNGLDYVRCCLTSTCFLLAFYLFLLFLSLINFNVHYLNIINKIYLHFCIFNKISIFLSNFAWDFSLKFSFFAWFLFLDRVNFLFDGLIGFWYEIFWMMIKMTNWLKLFAFFGNSEKPLKFEFGVTRWVFMREFFPGHFLQSPMQSFKILRKLELLEFFLNIHQFEPWVHPHYLSEPIDYNH